MADESTEPMAALDVGIAVAGDPDAAKAKAKATEQADVKRWFERYERARKFDEEARKQYAKDRRYARGDSGFEVDANIIGTNIDILESFLYARDPDVDVLPAMAVQPPSAEALRDAAEAQVMDSPDVQQAAQAASMMALQATGNPMEAQKAGKAAAKALADQLIEEQFQQLRQRYARRQRDNKAFGETLEIIISRLWRDAKLKKRGRAWVRSGLTVGVGILKASWQERTAPSPETQQAINDLQANIQQATALRAELAETDCADHDAKLAEYQRQLVVLQGQVEQVVARGFVAEVVQAEDFQVAPGYAIASHTDAPWNAHRIAMRCSDAKAQFALTPEDMKQAKRYSPRTPVMVQNESAMVDTVDALEADAYTAGGSQDMTERSGGDWVMLVEFWDRDGNAVLTGIEGIKRWVKRPWSPVATTRFYPFFLFCTSEVDGQRHPQSLVSRSAKLVDEYNRVGSAEAEHRRRVKPGILFHAGMVGQETMNKVNDSVTGEYIGIETTQPTEDLHKVFVPKQYPQLDMALYSRERIINEINRIWGTQEALAGAVQTEKTATESEIQDSGFKAREGSRRDAAETALGELAQYTAEVARANVTLEDAQAIAGPDAMWPEYTGPDDLASMVSVDIRAGSSGKPNTSADRQAWSAQLPILQAGIIQIGQLRQASPLDIADALEKLLQITAERSGDRIDIDQLVPQAGSGPMLPPPVAPGVAPPTGPTNPATPPPASTTAVPLAA